MMILLTYDVDFSMESGKKRLRKIAKLCEKFGVRVQNSVFEITVDPKQLLQLKADILRIIDTEKDSVRIYNLGKKLGNSIEILGMEKGFNQEDTLIL